MATKWQIAGVGSPHGDDRAGWELIERLSALHLPAELSVLDHPLDLLDLLSLCGNCQRLLVVDACATGASPGTLTRLVWPDRRIMQQHKHLTHSLALSDALQLADQLDRLPPLVILYGIEIASCQREAGLSPAVSRALPELGRQIETLIRQSQHLGTDPVPKPHSTPRMHPAAVRRLPGRSYDRRYHQNETEKYELPPGIE